MELFVEDSILTGFALPPVMALKISNKICIQDPFCIFPPAGYI